MKHLIGLRKQYRAFSRGSLRFLFPENPRVLAFIREYADERILVVANLSRFAQAVELDLAEFRGSRPVEMFGRTAFPPIDTVPYLITLSPHAFYWFLLQPEAAVSRRGEAEHWAPSAELEGDWQELILGESREQLEEVLPAYLRTRRWFRGKAREVSSVGVVQALPVAVGAREVLVTLVEVRYLDRDSEIYVMAIGFAETERARSMTASDPDSILLSIRNRGVLYEAATDEAFVNVLIDGVGRRRRWRGKGGDLVGSRTRSFRADQYIRQSGRPAAAEAVPEAGARCQSRPGDRAPPHRAHLLSSGSASGRRTRVPRPAGGADDGGGDPPVRPQRGRRLGLHG
jgi:maltose alpha-D-glucosyltransferase/alpha-amylase